MHTRRDRPKTRSDALRDALLPLAAKGVSAAEAMALIVAADAARRPDLGVGWAEIEAACDTVCAAPNPA